MHKAQIDFPVLDARAYGVANGHGLLHDLLEHEVRIAPFFRSAHIPRDVLRRLLHRVAEAVVHRNARACEHGKLPFVQPHDLTRMFQKRRNIGGDKVFSFSEAKDKRTVLSHCNEQIRMFCKSDAKRIGADEERLRIPHGLHRIAMIIIIHKLRNDFRIRVGLEFVAVLRQKLAQLRIIFHDAVMHHRHPAAV